MHPIFVKSRYERVNLAHEVSGGSGRAGYSSPFIFFNGCRNRKKSALTELCEILISK